MILFIYARGKFNLKIFIYISIGIVFIYKERKWFFLEFILQIINLVALIEYCMGHVIFGSRYLVVDKLL